MLIPRALPPLRSHAASSHRPQLARLEAHWQICERQAPKFGNSRRRLERSSFMWRGGDMSRHAIDKCMHTRLLMHACEQVESTLLTWRAVMIARLQHASASKALVQATASFCNWAM